MYDYFILLKRVKNKFIWGFILFIFALTTLLYLKNKAILLIPVYTLFALYTIIAIKTSFYARNTKLREFSSSISYVPFIFLLPIKRNKILNFEFIFDLFITFVYLLLFNICLLILKALCIIKSFSFISFFTLPLSFILLVYSLYTTLSSLAYLTKNSTNQSILETFAFLSSFLLAYFPVARLAVSTNEVEKIITSLCNQPKLVFGFLFISIVFLLISYTVNKIAIYRREI